MLYQADAGQALDVPHSPLRPDCCTQSPRRRCCSSSVFLSMSVSTVSCYRSAEPSSVVGGSRDEMGQEERGPPGW
uniref:Uncharacterized protein n=3 Tax=Homininae TaxID=207598 RepID=A0A2I3SK15_PANTR